MAKAASKQKNVRKKAKRVVVDAVAHVHASFNNTIVTITDGQGNTAFLGQLLVVLVFAVQEKVLRLQHRLQQSVQVTQLKNLACKILM